MVGSLMLAALLAVVGCAPSLITKTRTDPVYEVRRMQVADQPDRTGALQPVYEWQRIQVGVEKRRYKAIERHTVANLVAGVVVIAALGALGYYALTGGFCGDRGCGKGP